MKVVENAGRGSWDCEVREQRGGGGNKGEGSERLLRTKCKKESEGKKKRVLGLRGRTLLPHTESRLHH